MVGHRGTAGWSEMAAIFCDLQQKQVKASCRMSGSSLPPLCSTRLTLLGDGSSLKEHHFFQEGWLPKT